MCVLNFPNYVRNLWRRARCCMCARMSNVQRRGGGLIKARPALARARAQARSSLINSGRAPTDTLPSFLTEVTCDNELVARTYTHERVILIEIERAQGDTGGDVRFVVCKVKMMVAHAGGRMLVLVVLLCGFELSTSMSGKKLMATNHFALWMHV